MLVSEESIVKAVVVVLTMDVEGGGKKTGILRKSENLYGFCDNSSLTIATSVLKKRRFVPRNTIPTIEDLRTPA